MNKKVRFEIGKVSREFFLDDKLIGVLRGKVIDSYMSKRFDLPRMRKNIRIVFSEQHEDNFITDSVSIFIEGYLDMRFKSNRSCR